MSRRKSAFGSSYAEWARFMGQAGQLYVESATVINLRMLAMMTGGPTATREAQRMVSEKIEANIEAAFDIPHLPRNPAAAASAALLPYRKRVRANHKRLSGGAGSKSTHLC